MLGSIKNRLASMRAAPTPINDLLASVDDMRKLPACAPNAKRSAVPRVPLPKSWTRSTRGSIRPRRMPLTGFT